MALDGIVINALANELNTILAGNRIAKIAQTEKDELMISFKINRENVRLLLSANASLPLCYISSVNKPAPLTAPNFCMLLRKHIGSGRIVKVSQPSLERVIVFDIEHLDELGDERKKKLIIELMGKHSNIIFTDENDMIIDAIKHISFQVSSVREVLPGRQYFIPEQEGRGDILSETPDGFVETVCSKPLNITKAIYTSYVGISPLIANELCCRANLDGGMPTSSLDELAKDKLASVFESFTDDLKTNNYKPNIIFSDDEPIEFSALPLSVYTDKDIEYEESISTVLEEYYSRKNSYTRIRQKSADLRQVVNTALERNYKKFDLQSKQLKDTEKRDKYKVYGELIHTYGYGVEEGAKSFEALNYYTNENITIPLDPDLTLAENAKKYFDKYAKLKRTFEALNDYIEETKADIEHLESISVALDIAETESDLVMIRDELAANGYIKKHASKQKLQQKSKPYHYRSSDGFDIYVGKNNFQNDEITFKIGEGNDWWFHAKKIPGSHVLVKTKTGDIPDKTFEEAAALAAFYSKAKDQPKVEIDYLQKKNVKKPNAAKPGFVVYYTNFSMAIDPDISGIELINE